MAVDAGDRQPKEEGAAGLPAKVDSPSNPQGSSAEIGSGEHQPQSHGDEEAGAAGARHQGLDDGVVRGKADGSADGADSNGKALEPISAKGYFLGQGCERCV